MTNYHKLGDLEKQKFIVSEFWGLEVCNQDLSRIVHPLKPIGVGSLPVSL